mmetsp:Transcript_4074/g.6817  ORF Transcript_4074/g.6817 Transcript_4074/m.6817 type:complete len:127 (-) Transcript_4074:234-614(-)
MKIIHFIFLLLATARAFQQVQVARKVVAGVAAPLQMGLFDAFHGSGSADKDDLDEIWEAQQAILRARKGETKEHMRAKYKDSNRKFEVGSMNTDSKNKQDMNRVYVEEEKKPKKSGGSGFKMPWDK